MDVWVSFSPQFWSGHKSTILLFIVSIIIGFSMEGPLTVIEIHNINDKKLSLKNCLIISLRRPLKFISVCVLVGVLSYVAMFALIIPGIILLIVWSIAIPSFVNERCTVIESLRRSFYLTGDLKAKIFAIILVVAAGYALLYSVAAFAMISYGNLLVIHNVHIFSIMLSAIVVTFGNLLWASVFASLYAELISLEADESRLETIMA